MRANNFMFNYNRTWASKVYISPNPPTTRTYTHLTFGASASVSSKAMILLSLIHSSHCVWGFNVTVLTAKSDTDVMLSGRYNR